jgi:hypothetical protein
MPAAGKEKSRAKDSARLFENGFVTSARANRASAACVELALTYFAAST